MATISARMWQRRRTQAQFASENPTLAVGEIAVVTPAVGANEAPALVVGDGVTAYTALKGIEMPSGKTLLTSHDAKYAYAGRWATNGTEITDSGTDTGVPRTRMPDGVTTRVKWMWEIPIQWDGITVRFAATNPGVQTGNVKYQFAYKHIYLGEGNVITPTMTTIAMAASAAPPQNGYLYSTPSELVGIPTANGGLGDKPITLCAFSRLGADAADTFTGDIDLITVTGTRVNL